MTATMSSLVVTPASGFIGATVDVDLEALLNDEAQQAALRDALWAHQVIVLPELDPTAAQQIALARLFGPIQPGEAYNVTHADHPEITVFDSQGGYKADQWHCDASWRTEVPMGAVLCMRVCPPVGGDTVFTSCYAAYDALSTGMKQMLDGRRARHDVGPDDANEHPVVVEHPVTKRPVLFVNRIFTRSITNLPPAESDALLPFLIQHVTRPEFTYRHRWTTGDVLIWDNWSTQHYALFDFTEQRVVHRVGIAGRPLAAAALA